MNKIIKENIKTILFVISFTIFILLVILLLEDKVSYFDNFVYSIISKLRCKPLTMVFKFLSFLCSIWFLLIVTILCVIFSKNKKNAFYIALNIILCVLINQGLKLIFTRDRPIDINLIIESGYSFPSGHSMVSMAFYGFFVYIIAHKNMAKKKKWLYCSLFTLLIFLIGISRIYLGVHYASDVCAGFAMSMAYLIIYVKLFYGRMDI